MKTFHLKTCFHPVWSWRELQLKESLEPHLRQPGTRHWSYVLSWSLLGHCSLSCCGLISWPGCALPMTVLAFPVVVQFCLLEESPATNPRPCGCPLTSPIALAVLLFFLLSTSYLMLPSCVASSQDLHLRLWDFRKHNTLVLWRLAPQPEDSNCFRFGSSQLQFTALFMLPRHRDPSMSLWQGYTGKGHVTWKAYKHLASRAKLLQGLFR